ncbi:MAG TPA: BrnT family toxin [Terriglobia bacterium]|nr:BrnT family toxin [Terriglobia bacterium]
MTYERDPAKAVSNLRRHRVSFAEATSVFLDPGALTFADPDHSDGEQREVTIGYSRRQRVLFVAHCARGDRIRIISAREAARRERKQFAEQKGSAPAVEDDLRPECDLAQLRGGVRGKYYRQASAGSNLVLIEPDLARTFPDDASVNRALRLLVSTASAATRSARRPKATVRRRPNPRSARGGSNRRSKRPRKPFAAPA